MGRLGSSGRAVPARTGREVAIVAWSFKIGRLFGIEIRIHFILIVFFLFEFIDLVKFLPTSFILLWMFFVWLSILLHEFGHCFGARRVGGHADLIVLWPLGGLAFVGVPQYPRAQLIATAAGPAVSLALAGLLYGATCLVHPPAHSGAAEYLWFAARSAASFNGWVGLFNLLPAYPLDGGQIFQWLLVPRLGYGRATYVATRVGTVCGAVMVAVGLTPYGGKWLLGIGGWVLFECWNRQRQLAAGIDAGESWGGGGTGFHYLDSAQDDSYAAPHRGPRRARTGFFARLRDWWHRPGRPSAERTPPPERPIVDADLRRRVDDLLDKVSRTGLNSLTPEEREFLQNASRHYRDTGDDR